MRFAIIASLAVALAADPANSDAAAYYGTVDLSVASTGLRAIHHHDWRKRESFIRLLNTQTGRILRESTSPPLTTLWVSPDSAYVVGLSNIKLDNSVQVLVMRADGEILLSRSVSCRDSIVDSPPCTESVTNWVSWYNEDQPGIHLDGKGGRPTTLIVNAPIHTVCTGRDPDELSDEWREKCSVPPEKIEIPIPQ